MDRNSGAKFKVISYEPRPILKLIPAPEAKSQRVLHFTYIEAVRKLPVNFSSEELKPILKKVDSAFFHGRIRSVFIVLSDDMLAKRRGAVRSRVIETEDLRPEDETEIIEDGLEGFSEVHSGSGSGGHSRSNKRLADSAAGNRNKR